MTVTDVAFGSAWPRSRRPLPRLLTPLLAIGMSVAGLVALALAFAAPPTYEQIARASGFESIPFLVPTNVPIERRQLVRYDVATRTALHEQTLRSVLSAEAAPGVGVVGAPRDPTTGDPLFTVDEGRHLADVRRVFAAARFVANVGGVASILLLVLAWGRGTGVLGAILRDAALLSALAVAVVGAGAAIAFEPLFLAFHYVFFPQGNYLFDPAESNLLALYPEAYWYGVTLRSGAAFIAIAVAISLVGWVLARSARVSRR